MQKILIVSFIIALASMPVYSAEKVKPFELYTTPEPIKKEPYHSSFADNYYKSINEQSKTISKQITPNADAPILFVMPITLPGVVIDNAFVK